MMDGEVRLNRFLARCGKGSRRGCEDFIRAGRVRINGTTITDLSAKVRPVVDVVELDGVLVADPDVQATIMLHKPAGYVTTMHDPQGRRCVADLIPHERFPGIFPVGRLDTDTTGLLLFTTDGKLGHALLHPRHHVEKTYYALVDGEPDDAAIEQLRNGVQLDDGMTQPARVERLEGALRAQALSAIYADDAGPACDVRASSNPSDLPAILSIAIREGKKRQVKRMCSAVGHPVLRLHRPQFGSLALTGLPRGTWCLLTDAELADLKEAAGIEAFEDGVDG